MLFWFVCLSVMFLCVPLMLIFAILFSLLPASCLIIHDLCLSDQLPLMSCDWYLSDKLPLMSRVWRRPMTSFLSCHVIDVLDYLALNFVNVATHTGFSCNFCNVCKWHKWAESYAIFVVWTRLLWMSDRYFCANVYMDISILHAFVYILL